MQLPVSSSFKMVVFSSLLMVDIVQKQIVEDISTTPVKKNYTQRFGKLKNSPPLSIDLAYLSMSMTYCDAKTCFELK